MSDHISWTLDCSIHDGKVDELSELLAGLTERAQANEPGTLTYESFISADKSTLFTYERFADSAAALAHLGSFGEVAERFMACVDVKAFNVYGDPSDEVKAAIDGFSPGYLSPIAGFRR